MNLHSLTKSCRCLHSLAAGLASPASKGLGHVTCRRDGELPRMMDSLTDLRFHNMLTKTIMELHGKTYTLYHYYMIVQTFVTLRNQNYIIGTWMASTHSNVSIASPSFARKKAQAFSAISNLVFSLQWQLIIVSTKSVLHWKATNWSRQRHIKHFSSHRIQEHWYWYNERPMSAVPYLTATRVMRLTFQRNMVKM